MYRDWARANWCFFLGAIERWVILEIWKMSDWATSIHGTDIYILHIFTFICIYLHKYINIYIYIYIYTHIFIPFIYTYIQTLWIPVAPVLPWGGPGGWRSRGPPGNSTQPSQLTGSALHYSWHPCPAVLFILRIN